LVLPETTSTISTNPADYAIEQGGNSAFSVAATVSGTTVTLEIAAGSVGADSTAPVTVSVASGTALVWPKGATTSAQLSFAVTDGTTDYDFGTVSNLSLIPGPADASRSTLGASPATVTADNSSTSTLTLTTRDQHDNVTDDPASVALAATEGTLGPVSDSGFGTYSATYTASTSAGTATVTSTVDGSAGPSVDITLEAGAGSTSRSTVATADAQLVADAASSTTVTVTVLDANDNAVTGASVGLSATNGGQVGAVTDVGDGTYTATLTSSTTAGDALVAATIGAGEVVDTATVVFVAGAVDPTMSTLVADPTSFVANGTDTTSVVVSLKDVNGNPVGGYDLKLIPSQEGTVVTADGTTDVAGQVTFTYSTTFVGEVVLTAAQATDDTNTFGTVTVTTTAPPSGGGGTTDDSTTTTTEDGGTASTGDDATTSDPVQTSVTTPSGGEVVVSQSTTTTTTAPDGSTLLGLEVDIDAPDGTVEQPLELAFEVDVSLLDGVDVGRLTVVRNGVLVARCTGPGATPDPCVADVTVDADGDVTVDVRTSRASTWNVASVDSGCPADLVPDVTFADVAADGVHADAIACAVWSGLVQGFDADSYAPGTQVTRGQAALVLVALLEQAGVHLPVGDGRFVDVAGRQGAAAESLAAAGILQGTSSTTFEPDATLTRGELSALLVAVHAAAGGELPAGDGTPFDDVDGIFAIEVAQAEELGLTQGFTETTYRPQGEVTRGEYAAFVTRLHELLVRLGLSTPTL